MKLPKPVEVFTIGVAYPGQKEHELCRWAEGSVEKIRTMVSKKDLRDIRAKFFECKLIPIKEIKQ